MRAFLVAYLLVSNWPALAGGLFFSGAPMPAPNYNKSRTQKAVRDRISAVKHLEFLQTLSLDGKVLAATAGDAKPTKGYTTTWDVPRMTLRAKVSLALLDKVLPNLQSIAHTDPNGEPLKVIFTSADASVL